MIALYNRKDLLGLRDLSADEIMTILNTAKEMKAKIDNPSLRDDSLSNSVCGNKFYPKGNGI